LERTLVPLLLQVVFGSRAAAAAVPSMVALAERSPRLPHLLIDCEHEAFDVWPLEGVMQALLGGVEYATSLQRAGIRTVRVTVDSNHWAMLNCAGLREAMRAQLCERGWPSGRPDRAVAHSPSRQDAGTAQSHGSTSGAVRRRIRETASWPLLARPRQLTRMTRMNRVGSGTNLVDQSLARA
jgi:hypothetical protein